MTNAPLYDVGDRVRLREEGAQWWIDERLQRRARAGTPGTITIVIGTKEPAQKRSYRVEFDAVGRMRALSEIIPVGELEAFQ